MTRKKRMTMNRLWTLAKVLAGIEGSIERVASRLEMAPSTIYRWKGNNDIPSYESEMLIKELCNIEGVKYND